MVFLDDILNKSSVENQSSSYSNLIFPNPARDEIEINLNTSDVLKTSDVSEIEILNMLGEKVITKSIQPMTLTHRMNVGQLPTGMYIIKIGDRITKFIKE